jgi:hypothetical protein
MQQVFFLGEIFYVAWIGDHFKEDLAKFGYKLDNEVSILLINLLYLWLQTENRLYIILVIFTIFFSFKFFLRNLPKSLYFELKVLR